jgi:hypothetical protein
VGEEGGGERERWYGADEMGCRVDGRMRQRERESELKEARGEKGESENGS